MFMELDKASSSLNPTTYGNAGKNGVSTAIDWYNKMLVDPRITAPPTLGIIRILITAISKTAPIDANPHPHILRTNSASVAEMLITALKTCREVDDVLRGLGVVEVILEHQRKGMLPVSVNEIKKGVGAKGSKLSSMGHRVLERRKGLIAEGRNDITDKKAHVKGSLVTSFDLRYLTHEALRQFEATQKNRLQRDVDGIVSRIMAKIEGSRAIPDHFGGVAESFSADLSCNPARGSGSSKGMMLRGIPVMSPAKTSSSAHFDAIDHWPHNLVLEEMRNHDFEPTASSYNAILSFLFDQGLFEDALTLFQRFPVHRNIHTFTIAISALSSNELFSHFLAPLIRELTLTLLMVD
ncbi:hypothetical protein BC829DRAFT_439887 [Chytridium lagenaria]|nr:hypothetical protein BC829DRAFT_439887 [Chytridium lagenaria]